MTRPERLAPDLAHPRPDEREHVPAQRSRVARGRAGGRPVEQRVERQHLLRRPPAVDGGLAHAGPFGHRVHAHRAQSTEQEQLGGRVENRVSRLLAARPPAPRRVGCRLGVHFAPYRDASAGSPSGVRARPRRPAQAGEDLVQRCDVALAVAELARLGEHVVRGCGGGERDAQARRCLQREADVLVHQLHVEPRGLRQVEQEGDARLEHRRADRALAHDPRGESGIDAAALGQQQPFAEGQRLDREADVDRQLEQQALAVLTDASHGLAELAEQRLHEPEGRLLAAHHDGERPGLGLRNAARDRSVEHPGADRSHPLGDA